MLNLKNYVALSGKFINQPAKTLSKNKKDFFKNRFQFFNPKEGNGYITVVAFGEVINDLVKLSQNDLVEIQGVLENQSYISSDNEKKYILQIIIKTVQLIQKDKFKYQGGNNVENVWEN